MMHRLLMIIPAYRRMHVETAALTVEVAMLRARLEVSRKSVGFAYDMAYERRQALRAIAECETPKSNGTVRKMAAIAKDALKSSTLSGDLVRQYEERRAARGVAGEHGLIEVSSMDGDTKFVKVGK